MAADPKKSFQDKSYKSYKNTAFSWWSKFHLKYKFLFLIILFSGLIAVAGLSGLLWPDKNTQRINTINQMSAALSSAQPVVTDFYTSLSAYDSGKIDSKTAISKLQADKKIVDGLISKMQSKNPPDELKYSYGLVLSSLQDLSASIGLGIDGIRNNNFMEIDQAISLNNNLTIRFNEATDEVSKLRYPTS